MTKVAIESNLMEVFSRFSTEGTFLSGSSFGPGHIHTYRIITAENDCDDYILQRLNNNVFRNIPHLQENTGRVDSYSTAFEGGRAIGKLQAMPADMPGDPLHNLQRNKVQITLLKNMESQYSGMVEIIKKITK